MARKRSRGKFNPDPLVEDVTNRLMEYRGYSIIGIPREIVASMIREIVLDLASQMATKPKPDPVFNRIKRNIAGFEKALAAKLLEKTEEPRGDVLEFIITRNPELAVKAAPRLYPLLKRVNRGDLVEVLRDLWNSSPRGFPLVCPRCGFRSLTPDFTCVVCGYTAREEEVKEANNFEEKLSELMERLDSKSLEMLLQKGFVYVLPDGRLDVGDKAETQSSPVIFLSKSERELVRSRLEQFGKAD